jgi:hypothetical protein
VVSIFRNAYRAAAQAISRISIQKQVQKGETLNSQREMSIRPQYAHQCYLIGIDGALTVVDSPVNSSTIMLGGSRADTISLNTPFYVMVACRTNLYSLDILFCHSLWPFHVLFATPFLFLFLLSLL